MAKPKAQTLQQRFGFMDKDLTTPKHDEIMIWLDANLEQVIKAVRGWKPRSEQQIANARKKAQERIEEYRKEKLAEVLAAQEKKEEVQKASDDWDTEHSTDDHKPYWYDRAISDAQFSLANRQEAYQKALDWSGLGSIPEFDDFVIERNIWEYAVVTANNSRYTIGFIDLFAEGRLYTLKLDLNNLPKWEIDWSKVTVLFEVKSSIPSLGEAIRQIRMYQTHVHGTYVIVSPDDRFASALEAQGIRFYKCPGAVADIWDSVA